VIRVRKGNNQSKLSDNNIQKNEEIVKKNILIALPQKQALLVKISTIYDISPFQHPTAKT
jgi:hypothetical protein